MKFKLKLFLSLLVLGLGFVFCVTPNEVFASSKIISISPVVKKMNLDANGSDSGNVIVGNDGDEPFYYALSVYPYQVENGSYEPIYDLRNNYTKIVDWITLEKDSGYLEPDQTVSIKYNVNVPDDVPSGGQYAIISVSTTTEGGVVSASSSVGMILSAEISGNTRKEGAILSEKIPGFLLAAPVKGTVSLSNTGNVSNEATVTLKVNDYFSGAEVYSNANSPMSLSLLPETTRDVEVAWERNPIIGIYKVVMTTDYINNISTVTKVVFLCPIWIIAIFIAIIIAIGFIIMSKRIKKQKIKTSGFKFRN